MSQSSESGKENSAPILLSTSVSSSPAKSTIKLPPTVLGAIQKSIHFTGKRASDGTSNKTASKRSKLDGTRTLPANDDSDNSDPDDRIICTAYIDAEAKAPSVKSFSRRPSQTAKPVGPPFERTPAVLQFAATTSLDDLISQVEDKLKVEPFSIKRSSLMWRYETPAKSVPKPFGSDDGMLALQDELKRTAGKKSIIIQVGPLKKKQRVELEDDGHSAKEQEDEMEDAVGDKVRIFKPTCRLNDSLFIYS